MDFDLYGPNGQIIAKAQGSKIDGSVLVRQGGSAYDEAVERGGVFVCASQATVTTQAGLSATTPGMTVNNRNGSGKEVLLWYAGWETLVSATAAFIAWLAQGDKDSTDVTETTPSTTIRNAKTGVKGAPEGVGISIVSTLPAAPIAVASLHGASSAAITVGLKNAEGSRWFNGAMRLQPGMNWSIQTSTAGTIFSEFIIEVRDK